MQEERAREISDKLRLRLTGKEAKHPVKRHTDNAEAYKLYLKGRFQWNKRTRASYVSPFDLALIYAGLEEKEEALPWLEKAYEERNQWLTWLHVEPRFDTLREATRFQELVRRVGLA